MNSQTGQILVVEDEVIVGMELHMLLSDAGYEVIGPVGSKNAALELIRSHALDGAVLDINLHGVKSFEIADTLAEAEVPFILVTGHERQSVPLKHRERPIVGKPYDPEDVLLTLVGAISEKSRNPPVQLRR